MLPHWESLLGHVTAVGSGKIEKYSEDWYDMQSSIDSVTSSILDAEKALIEYDNAIRQIKWDAFDRTRDDVENLLVSFRIRRV